MYIYTYIYTCARPNPESFIQETVHDGVHETIRHRQPMNGQIGRGQDVGVSTVLKVRVEVQQQSERV